MIDKNWINLKNEYKQIKLHNHIIMPNHFHWIIEILENNKKCDCKICRGAPCGYPKNQNWQNIINKNQNSNNEICPYNKNILWNIIWWFKSITSHNYIKMVKEWKAKIFNKKLWQRNFYDHIIRNKESYIKISEYVENNPIKWKEDKFYYTEI
jgi:REP element-mobilizing transposase RayT